MAPETARRCPCMAADEEHDAQETGGEVFHWITVRRETSIDYTLDPEELKLQPDEKEAEEEALDPLGRGLWSVSCEHCAEDGPWVQAAYLEDALLAWAKLWRVA